MLNLKVRKFSRCQWLTSEAADTSPGYLYYVLPQHYSMLHLCLYHKTVFRPHLISSLRAFQMSIY